MTHIPRAICMKCRREMRPHENGRVAEAITPDDLSYYKIDSDIWRCGSCGTEVAVGFAQNPVAHHFQDGYDDVKSHYRFLFSEDKRKALPPERGARRCRTQFIIGDREDAESFIPGREDVCISITSPGSPPAALREGWRDVLRVEFHDYPWTDGPDFEQNTVQSEQCERIAAFALKHRDAKRMLVHCEAGISRSVAVCNAISTQLAQRWTFPSWYSSEDRANRRLANRPVFDRVCAAIDAAAMRTTEVVT